jgi:hypothetical protein
LEKEYSVTNSVFSFYKKKKKKKTPPPPPPPKQKKTNKSARKIVTIADNMKGRLRFSTFIF